MKILYVTQFYKPENIAGAFRAADHSAIWSEMGHDVVVYTAYPNYPIGRIFEGYSNEMFSDERDGSVWVVRNKIGVKPNTNLIYRMINGSSYLFNGIRNINRLKELTGSNYDIVVASSGPVFTGILGKKVSKCLHAPFVIEFRDIAFEQMVATGTDWGSWKIKLLKRLELSFCKASKHVIVLTEGFKKILIENSVDEKKIAVVPNGANVHVVERSSEIPILSFGYFGTIGISQDVNRTIDIIKDACCNQSFKYILIGEGANRTAAEEKTASPEYSFVEMHHGMSISALDKFYSLIDFSVVSLRKCDSFAATIPSKIFQSFARGIPVVFIGPEGEAAELVRSSGAGVALVGNDEENAKKLSAFISSENIKSRIDDMREKAAEVIETRYSRTKMAEKMISEFTQVIQEGK